MSLSFSLKEPLTLTLIFPLTSNIGFIKLILPKAKIIHCHRNSKDTKREYIDVYLKASKFKGELLNLEPDKCSELKWFNSHEYPENIVPEVKSVLENLSKGNFFSTLGF